MLRRVLFGVLIAAMFLVGGCSGGEAADTTTGEPAASEPAATEPGAAAEAEAGPAVIALPDGWGITDAITAEQVGEITGKKMTYFPEAGSAAQDGKPMGSFTNEGAPNSKLTITIEAAGGQATFDRHKEFAEPESITPVTGIGDDAYTCTFTGGTVGIVVRKGDAVMRIEWPPAAYGDDAQGIGGSVAELLMYKMFQ